MPRIRSFRRRVFLAVLAVALVPTIAALAGGTLLLREIGSSTGTLGPWDTVASSGRELIDAARDAAPNDSAVAASAARHGEALSASVRQSRLYTLVTERVISLLPLAALAAAVLLGGLAAWTAGSLSRSFSEPIRELVGWTERIARSEPLPPREASPDSIAEFGRLRSSLRTMAQQLEHARAREVEGARLRAWTEMARRVAHELKNPLTPMRMSASALVRSDDADSRAAGELLLEEIGRLDEMARTFAQFGRMPEGPAAQVDLGELAQSVARRHDGTPAPVRVSVASGTPMVLGHHDTLARALGNLVVNAQESLEAWGEEHVRPAGAVEIRVEPCARGARIVVEDDGPGIPTEILETVWHPDVTTKRRGTGLGLALVRQAVEAHGGTADAGNRAEGGARFTIELPLEPPEAR